MEAENAFAHLHSCVIGHSGRRCPLSWNGNSGKRADQVGGKMTCKTTEQHSVPVEGDPGHVLVVQIETCVGAASDNSARFDGGCKHGSKWMIWSEVAE
jgi:hypothetical protein